MINTDFAATPHVVVCDECTVSVTIGGLSHDFECDDLDTTNADHVTEVAIEWLGAFHYGPNEMGDIPDALSDLCERLESAIVAAIPPVWTYEGYWNTVIGANRGPEDVVREFGLVADGLDGWLGAAESAAWRDGGIKGDLRDHGWAPHHARALTELAAAVEAS